jgi:hypothetical protein
MRTKLAVLGEYVGHLVVGAAMFAALLFFGVALHLLADWAETEREVRTSGFDQAELRYLRRVGRRLNAGRRDRRTAACGQRKIIRELRGDE